MATTAELKNKLASAEEDGSEDAMKSAMFDVIFEMVDKAERIAVALERIANRY